MRLRVVMGMIGNLVDICKLKSILRRWREFAHYCRSQTYMNWIKDSKEESYFFYFHLDKLIGMREKRSCLVAKHQKDQVVVVVLLCALSLISGARYLISLCNFLSPGKLELYIISLLFHCLFLCPFCARTLTHCPQ